MQANTTEAEDALSSIPDVIPESDRSHLLPSSITSDE